MKRKFVIFFVTFLVSTFRLMPPSAHADQNWDGDNAVGNFSFGDNWFGNTVGGPGGFGFGNGSLHFSFRNNAAQSSIYYDFVGFADTNDIFWDSTFGAGLTIDGNGQGLNFNQRLENDSSFTQTIGSSMKLSGAKNGASQIELNPVNASLIINGSIFNDNSKPYYVFGNNGKTLTLNSTLGVGSNAASVSLNLSGNSIVSIAATQSYAGGTVISAGTIRMSGSGTLGSTGATLTINAGSLDLNGTSQAVGALNGTGGSITSSTGSSSLTVGTGNTTGSYAGSITNTGSIALTKTGSGTQTLTANNSYTGATTINGGTLRLAGTSTVLTGTSGISVNRGGTLLFAGNNQINQATTPPIALGTATGTGIAKIDAGGFSQGAGGTSTLAPGTVGLGALTLNSTSTVDLTSTSVLHFANSSSNVWTGTLSILNWNGTVTTGGGAEQILFGTSVAGLTAAQLSQISFIDPAGFAPGTYFAAFATDLTGEIVPSLTPVPEPSTWAAGVLALGGLAFSQRRRLRSSP